MKLKSNTVVVMEGLDATGKSTQAELAADALDASLIHMPSGWDELSRELYHVMEGQDMRPLTRQMIHFACHEANLHRIYEQLQSTGVIMDRWWWSPLAYGYYGSELDTRFPLNVFMNTMGMVWSGFPADKVFLFEHTYREDKWNNERIRQAYNDLGYQHEELTSRVPEGSVESVHEHIINEIKEAGLCT